MPARFEPRAGNGRAPARLREAGVRVRAALRSALESLGPQLLAAIREEMRAAQPDLHPFTVARNGGRTRPLVGTRIDEALSWRVEATASGSFVWAGVPASAGEEVLTLTRVHEHGATIAVTPAMRGYLHAQGLHLKPDTAAIVIPPRPFIKAGLARSRGAAREVVKARVSRALKGG